MTLEDRIRTAYPSMSKSFIKLADYLLDHYIEAAFMTATELAHAVSVDTTTVVRFSQQLGYSGYPPLLKELKNRVQAQLVIAEKKSAPDTSATVIERALRNLGDVLRRAYILMDVDSMDRLANEIGKASRIFIIHDTLAQPAAYTLVSVLERGRFPVTVVQASTSDLARALFIANKNDLFIAIEVTGDIPQISKTLAEAINLGCQTAAVMSAASFSSSRITDIPIAAQTQPSSELRLLLVNAVMYALGEVIIWKYSERYRESEKEIALMIQSLLISEEDQEE